MTSTASEISAIRMSAMSIGRRPRVGGITSAMKLSLTCPPEHKHCLQPGCDYDGPNQAALDLHLQQDHFQCVGCERILPSQNKLNQHYETCKSAVACHQCGVACAGQVQLALHLEHCFLCQECDYWTHHEGNYQIVGLLTISRSIITCHSY